MIDISACVCENIMENTITGDVMDIDGLRHYDHDPLDDEDERDRGESPRWYGPVYTIIEAIELRESEGPDGGEDEDELA